MTRARGGELLSDRALNRATLARQLLLKRSSLAPINAVGHLVGLQAQNPLDPYLALWSRLEAFDPVELGRQLVSRSLVRIVVMRGTIHLLTADDALELRPQTQPIMDAEIARHPEFAPRLAGLDLIPILEVASRLLNEAPRTSRQLRAELGKRFPGVDPGAMAYACRCLLALIQVPPRGVWGSTSQVTLTPLESWVARPLSSTGSIDSLVLRYLAAFGPATAADAARWSGLPGIGNVLNRLRPRLRVFSDARGRELFDLPDAPRPGPDLSAPVRILPEYDNLLLAHADRSRFGYQPDSFAAATGPFKGSVLVDGLIAAIWHIDRDPKAKRIELVVEHLPLQRDDAAAVEHAAHQASRFLHPDAAGHVVRLVPVPRR